MQLKNKLYVLMDLPHTLFRQFGIVVLKQIVGLLFLAKLKHFSVCLGDEEHWAAYSSLWIMTTHINI